MARNLWLIFPLVLIPMLAQARDSKFTWHSPTFNQQEFAKDKYQCMKETGSNGKIIDFNSPGMRLQITGAKLQRDGRSLDRINKIMDTQSIFVACMESKGYELHKR